MAAAVRPAEPLVVEVMAPGLVGFGLPRSLPGPGRVSARPSDVGGEHAYRLLGMLDRLHQRFGNLIVIHLIEPLSWGWMVRVLRHRPRRYPVFVVGGEAVVAGFDEEGLSQAVARMLGRGEG